MFLDAASSLILVYYVFWKLIKWRGGEMTLPLNHTEHTLDEDNDAQLRSGILPFSFETGQYFHLEEGKQSSVPS